MVGQEYLERCIEMTVRSLTLLIWLFALAPMAQADLVSLVPAQVNPALQLRLPEGFKAAASVTPIIKNLPTGGHTLKTLRVGPDRHFYINVGSSCNVCDESGPLRATILRYTLEGQPAGAMVPEVVRWM